MTGDLLDAGASAPVDQAGMRAVMSRWASGVAVVTTRDATGWPHGFTATSFTVVSLAPPLVLVCLDRAAACAPAFAESEWYAVHMLAAGQEDVARRFARSRVDRFEGLMTGSGHGAVPLLAGTAARLECRTVTRTRAGDHTILLAEVVATAVEQAARPLLYWNRSFTKL